MRPGHFMTAKMKVRINFLYNFYLNVIYFKFVKVQIRYGFEYKRGKTCYKVMRFFETI